MKAEDRRTIIKKHLGDWSKVQLSSALHFAESGRVSGGLLKAIEAIMEDYASSKWVSVEEEGVPTYPGQYIAFGQYTKNHKQVVKPCVWTGTQWYAGDMVFKVSKYMPLPSPPNNKEK